MQNGLSRKPRNDVDHLQVEAALLSVAGKRHFEERSIEAGSRCGCPHNRADAFQEAHDGQGSVLSDPSLQVLRSPEMCHFAFPRHQLIHGRQDKIVEIPSIGMKASEEVTVACKDFLD